jgi:hypothetical protein
VFERLRGAGDLLRHIWGMIGAEAEQSLREMLEIIII